MCLKPCGAARHPRNRAVCLWSPGSLWTVSLEPGEQPGSTTATAATRRAHHGDFWPPNLGCCLHTPHSTWGCTWEPNRRCSIPPAPSAASSREIEQCCPASWMSQGCFSTGEHPCSEVAKEAHHPLLLSPTLQLGSLGLM